MGVYKQVKKQTVPPVAAKIKIHSTVFKFYDFLQSCQDAL